MATAGFERGLLLRSPARFMQPVKKLITLYKQYEAQIGVDFSIRKAVVDCWNMAQSYALSAYFTVGRLQNNEKIGAESSINKIIWSELDLKIHETAMTILGDRAEFIADAPHAYAEHDWMEGFLFAQAGPIYAGTNEIQRNIVAERLLNLPK